MTEEAGHRHRLSALHASPLLLVVVLLLLLFQPLLHLLLPFDLQKGFHRQGLGPLAGGGTVFRLCGPRVGPHPVARRAGTLVTSLDNVLSQHLQA